MAAWESAPLVSEESAAPRAGLDTRGRPAPAAITPQSALPNVAPPQSGAPAAGLDTNGSPAPAVAPRTIRPSDIPGGDPEWDAGRTPAQTRREPNVREKVIGAVEAGIETLIGLTGGYADAVLGGGKRETTGSTVSDAMRTTLQANPFTGPLFYGLRAAGGGLGQGMSPTGRGYLENVSGVMENLPAIVGVHGSLAGPASSRTGLGLRKDIEMAADPVVAPVRSAADAVSGLVRGPTDARAPAEPGAKPSAGAAGTKATTQREARAAELGIPLTKGQREGGFEQQRFERETAKQGEVGRPLRERYSAQNERVLTILDDATEQTGARDLESNAVGKSVTDPIVEKAMKARDEIRAAYGKAEAAGETAELVPTGGIVDALSGMESSKENAGVISAAEKELIRLGGATRGADGQLIAGEISLADLEEVRKVIGKNGGKDDTNAHFAGELRGAIDAATEGRGGELYKAARALHREYAAEFKNQGVIRDLIGLKKGTSDRKVALADVFDRSVLNASLEDLRNVKRTLTTAGDKGVQAWNDLRGKTMDWIREQAAGNVARDERGNPIVSPAKLDRAVKRLDEDGRLEELFGKQGAQQLRDINDLAKDIYTTPPGAVNTSNTGSLLIHALDTMATYVLSGGTIPLPAMAILRKTIQHVKERKVKAKVRYALGPGDFPVAERAPRAFEPGKEPPVPQRGSTPPAPQTPPSAPAAPAAGAAAPRGTKRERDLVALREHATDPQVLKDLDAEIAAERRSAADARRAAEYRAIAEQTDDADIKVKFTAKAEKLAPAPKKAPEPESEPIPVGEARELTDAEIDPVDRVRIEAEFETAWRREHRVGDLDAERAKALAKADQYDPAEVERVVQQHENSPRALDREVARIIEEGEAREAESKQAPGGGAGVERSAEADRGETGGGAEPPRPDGAPAARAQRGEAEAAGRQANRRLTDARAAFDRNTRPTGNPITDRLSAKLREDYAAAVREYAARPDADEGRVLSTDIARELSPDYLADRTRSASVHEPASAFIKRLYAEKLAALTPEGRDRAVLFTAGGTGAGKTTGVNAMGDAIGRPEIKYDTNMNSLQSAVEKIDAALEAGRSVRIIYTYADPIEAFYQAMSRSASQTLKHGTGRTVPIDEHVKTHVGASEVIRQLSDRYNGDLRVEIMGVNNSLGKGRQRIATTIHELPRVRDNGLREVLHQAADQALARGEIDAATHAGFTRSGEALRHEGVGQGVLPPVKRGRLEGTNARLGAQEAGLAPAAQPAPYLGAVGSASSVITERGLRVPVRYRLAEISQLVTSHDDALKPNPRFDQTLQPRDRTRISSEAQITTISNTLQPELLGESTKPSDGAPIVGADGIVESGNARTIALRRAYAGGKADGYRRWLEENAVRFGLTPDQVRSVKQPVLVRERTGEVDRADFARQANESPIASMSETEQARSDARKLPDLDGLVTNDDGTVSRSASAEFIRQFMRYVVSPNEHNQMMTGDGLLSQRGAARIRNAVFARAYSDPGVIAMLTESNDGNVRNVLGGLLRAAPEVARVRDLLDAGAREGHDFAPDLVEAVRRFSQAREAGQKVEQYLAQGTLIADGAARPRVADLMRALERDARAPVRIAEMIRGLTKEIDARGDPRQSVLLGAVPIAGGVALAAGASDGDDGE